MYGIFTYGSWIIIHGSDSQWYGSFMLHVYCVDVYLCLSDHGFINFSGCESEFTIHSHLIFCIFPAGIFWIWLTLLLEPWAKGGCERLSSCSPLKNGHFGWWYIMIYPFSNTYIHIHIIYTYIYICNVMECNVNVMLCYVMLCNVMYGM